MDLSRRHCLVEEKSGYEVSRITERLDATFRCIDPQTPILEFRRSMPGTPVARTISVMESGNSSTTLHCLGLQGAQITGDFGGYTVGKDVAAPMSVVVND
jgi:hypothetical protein